MAFPNVLLDTSWTIQRVPNTRRRLSSLHVLVDNVENLSSTSTQLQRLSEECYEYLQSRTRAEPQDELNDRNEKTGQLRECAISPLQNNPSPSYATSSRPILGLLIETRYQKTTYQLILLAATHSTRNECPISMMLFRGNRSHIKHIEDWLELKFSLPSALQLQLSSSLLLSMFSEYLSVLTSSSSYQADSSSALRLAMLKQLIGTFKMTITFSNAAGTGIAPMLKTMDLDVPAETVGTLLTKARNDTEDGTRNFLQELKKALYEKTGLKLPLTAEDSISLNAEDELDEPPLKVTRITCAAFAVSVEGKIKIASKPAENAELIGYGPETITAANWRILDLLRQEVEKVSETGE